MDGRSTIQQGKTDFGRAAVLDRSCEPQHSWAVSETACASDRLDAARAGLALEAPELLAPSASNPRLIETGATPSRVPASSFAGVCESTGDGITAAFREGRSALSGPWPRPHPRQKSWLEQIRAGLHRRSSTALGPPRTYQNFRLPARPLGARPDGSCRPARLAVAAIGDPLWVAWEGGRVFSSPSLFAKRNQTEGVME